MAVIETWLEQDLQKPVRVKHLDGNFFSNNANGNRIGVAVYNNGAAVTLSGTVSGYVVLSDGTTVPCTGSRSGNKASVLVPPAAYQPGLVLVTVFLTDGNTVTTLAAVSANVQQARTDQQVSPGSVVTDWTNTINAAMQSVETAAANLGNIVATPYADLTFPVPLGKYTIYNNGLYRCISPIASSEAWTAAHWTNVKLGDDVADLKSAIESTIYETRSYKNQSATNAGNSAFVCYFNEPTYVEKIKPLFAVSGAFKWGIFTANGSIDAGASSQGSTEWIGQNVATSEEITLNRTFAPNEGFVIQAISPAASCGGVVLSECELPDAHFAQMNSACTFASHYFDRTYGFPAVFTVPALKNIPGTETFEELQSILPEMYAEIGYANESNGTVGTHALFGATFPEAVYFKKIMPLFSSQGTFKLGIFKITSGNTGVTTWLEDTFTTGDIITIDRTMQTDEALVVQTLGDAILRNGVPKQMRSLHIRFLLRLMQQPLRYQADIVTIGFLLFSLLMRKKTLHRWIKIILLLSFGHHLRLITQQKFYMESIRL